MFLGFPKLCNMRRRITIDEFFRRHWLLVGILVCIFVASLYPEFGAQQGPLRTEYSVKYGAISLIFFLSGISLRTDNIISTFHQYKIHLFIQLFTFFLIPLFTQLFVRVLAVFSANTWVLKGLLTVACMPPPVSSAVILTRASNGNETAAIFNSVLGSFLGILITPMLLLFNLGFTTVIPLLGTIVQLATTVLIPLCIGQIVRNYTSWKWQTNTLSLISQCSLLFVIYTTFCDTFKMPEPHINASDILTSVFAVLLMQISVLALSYYFSLFFRRVFNVQDIVAILFCSTHKSLTLGIPILKIMFHGFSHMSQVSLPLLIYHPTQIILGGMLVSQLKDWVQLHKNKKRLPI